MREKLLLELKRQAALQGADEAQEEFYATPTGNQLDTVMKFGEIYENVTGTEITTELINIYLHARKLTYKGLNTEENGYRNRNLVEVNAYIETLKGN